MKRRGSGDYLQGGGWEEDKGEERGGDEQVKKVWKK